MSSDNGAQPSRKTFDQARNLVIELKTFPF